VRYGVRQKSDLTGPFYGKRQLPLVLGAIARYSSWDYLAAFGNKIAKCLGILIVDLQVGIHTETADLSPRECAPFTPDVIHNWALFPYRKGLES
jgi:hypothetical protein